MKPYEATAREEWSLPLDGESCLAVSTPSGAIHLEAGETEEIRVEATRRVRAEDEATAAAFLERMEIERRREGERWVIQARWPEPKPHGVQSPQVSFRVQLPAGLRVEAQTGHGSIDALGVAEARLRSGAGDLRAARIGGALQAETGHGSIHVEECGGPIEIKSSAGDLRVRSVRERVKATTGHGSIQVEACDGPAEIDTSAGDVRVKELPGAVQASSGHGRIEAAGIGEARLRSSSGDVVVREAAGGIEARSGHGRIHVEACAGPVDAETGAGDILLRQVDGPVRAKTGHGSLRVFDVGEARLRSGAGDLEVSGGAGSVDAHTGHGGIRIDACAGRVSAESSAGGITIHAAHSPVRAHTGHGSVSVELAPADGPTEVDLAANGTIDLAMPPDISARLEASTGAGTIELNGAAATHSRGHRGHLNTVLGSGEGTIRLRTGHGNVRVRMLEPAGAA